MAVNWNLAVPTQTMAPQSSLQKFMTGMQQGSAVSAGLLANQAQLQANQVQPQMDELKMQTLSQGIDAGKIEMASKTYELANQILAPAAMALQNGDEQAAKEIYERGYKGLKDAGLNPGQFGAPEKFDPNFVQSAYTNVTAQLKQMQAMLGMQKDQSEIDKNQSTIQKNQYDMGMNVSGGQGGFSFPGQGGSGLGTKQQQELALDQAKKFQEDRQKASQNANESASMLSQVNQARSLLDSKVMPSGPGAALTKYISPDTNKLEKLYNSFITSKLKTDYAGNGLGSLDVAVFNVLKGTVPAVDDFASTQRTTLDNMEAGLKGAMLSSDIANKLYDLGIQDPAIKNAIGNKVAEKLGIKAADGTLNLKNFENADGVTNEVINDYMKNGQSSLTSKNFKPQANLPSDADLSAAGLNAEQIKQYKELAGKKR